MKYVVSYTEAEVAVYSFTQPSEIAALVAREDAAHVRVKSKGDLGDIPTAVLVRLFNASAEQPVTRFKDRATAESRVFELLPHVAVSYAAADAIEPDSPPRTPKLGVIATLKGLLEREMGVRIAEAVVALSEAFPDRRPEGMATTVRIQLGRLGKTPGRQILVDVDEQRGRVYRLS
jgi:hypothetical protein